MTFISENTQALLLLTAPLIVGAADGTSTPLLSLSEFNKLARRLKEIEAEPVDLIGPARSELLRQLSPLQSPDRLGSLLDRGFQMSPGHREMDRTRNLDHEQSRRRLP